MAEQATAEVLEFPQETKTCTKCGEVKPRGSFTPHKYSNSGLQAWCRKCSAAAKRARRSRLSLGASAIEGIKRCSACKQTKHVTEFNRSRDYPDGRAGRCRECSKAATAASKNVNRSRHNLRAAQSNIKRKYGLTPQALEALIAAQSGKCAICVESLARGMGKIAVDHDHETSAIRGILCGRCNTGLGLFRDNELFLRSAIEYLRRSQ